MFLPFLQASHTDGRGIANPFFPQPNPDLEAELKTRIIAVDYADVEAVTKVLEENNVHTVISAITMLHMGGPEPKEVELIRAADASKVTKRMISSDWGPPHIKE